MNGGNQLVALSAAPGTVRSEIWLNRLNPWTQKIVDDDNVSGSAMSCAASISTPGTYRVWTRSVNGSEWQSIFSSPVDFVVV